MQKNQIVQTQRAVYLDALRVAAMVAVTVIHLAATGYTGAAAGSGPWYICLSYHSAARFAVPVFVMISGALFLDPQSTLTAKTVLKKALRLLMIYLSWSALYGIAHMWEERSLFTPRWMEELLLYTLQGHYHMWYLPMAAGLYLLMLLLRPLMKRSRWNTVLLFLCPVRAILCLLGSVAPPDSAVAAAERFLREVSILDYADCCILGCYLAAAEVTEKSCRRLWLVTAVTVMGAVLISWQTGKPALIYAEPMPHIRLYGAAVFLSFRMAADRSPTGCRILSGISRLAPYTLGVYLLHPAVNYLLRKLLGSGLTDHPLAGIPLGVALVCALCVPTVRLVKKMPFFRHFL